MIILRTIDDLPSLRDQFVLLRPALDLPRSLPTVQRLLNVQAKVLILGHGTGRLAASEKDSFFWYAEELAILLRRKLVFIEEDNATLPDYDVPHILFFRQSVVEGKLGPLLSEMRQRDIAVLENLNLYDGENQGSEDFAKSLAALAPFYIQDDFASVVESYASVARLPEMTKSGAGEALARETAIFERARKSKRPILFILGGCLTDYKLPVLPVLCKLADKVILGGEFANLFLGMAGYNVGKSAQNRKHEAVAKGVWRDFRDKLVLPSDLLVSRDKVKARVVAIDKVRAEDMIMDIGPQSIQDFSGYFKPAASIIWYGALGLHEDKRFSHGTSSLSKLFAGRSGKYAYGILAGNGLVKLFAREHLIQYVDFVASGGEAMLAVLAGQAPVGIKVLEK